MKYEMQVWVTVSAESEYKAGKEIRRQLECRPSYGVKSQVDYIDSEALKAEPECGSCGFPLLVGETDYNDCPSCALANARADAKGGTL